MSKTNHLDASLKAMGIAPEGVSKMVEDAEGIVAGVQAILSGEHSTSGKGLIYGRIQSGKTRAMIASSALLFDQGTKIIVILTSNMNELVRQTYERFDAGLTQVSVLAKEDDLPGAIIRNKIALANKETDAKLMLVMPKGAQALEKTKEFLEQVGAKDYPVVIYDDEADQASLDTTRAKKGKGIVTDPSTIYKNIELIRGAAGSHVFIAVTGTPNANLLQTEDERPDEFVFILKPGDGYVGGKDYFEAEEISANNFMVEIPADDQTILAQKDMGAGIPSSLQRAVISFVFRATLANYKKIICEEGKGYQFLCHPSHKVLPQGNATAYINTILNQLAYQLSGTDTGCKTIVEEEIALVVKEHGLDSAEWVPLLKKEALSLLQSAKVVQVNSTTGSKIVYSSGLNILIGGNSLGRGVTIPNLITTYYTRGGGKVSYADTLHQHARMFGYRQALLPYIKIYITENLYSRFRNVVLQDERLRDFIEKRTAGSPIPIVIPAKGIKPTRSSVLPDCQLIDSGQKYPNPIDVKKLSSVHGKVFKTVAKLLGTENSNVDAVKEASVSQKDKEIDVASLKEIIGLMELEENGSLWNPDSLEAIVKALYGDKIKIHLNVRTSDRKVTEGVVGGSSQSGILYGEELTRGLAQKQPTLWLHSVTNPEEGGARFVYPTLLLPTTEEVVIINNV